MKLVTQTDVLARTYGDEEAIKILAQNGFDALDWSFFEMTQGEGPWCREGWREHALHLKEVAQQCGIGFSQAHAPFPSSRGEEPYDTVIFERILRSMEVASIFGVRTIVVHPMQHLPYSKNRRQLFQMNLDFYRRLIPYCEKFHIRVAAENMWQYDDRRHYVLESVCAGSEEFCALLDELNSPWIVGCLDIGHCGLMEGEPADFIRALGQHRLQALHVHDVDFLHDCHTLPFMEKIDWESVTSALAEIGYTGDFTFEADNFLAAFPKELQPSASALMEKTGRYLIERIQVKQSHH